MGAALNECYRSRGLTEVSMVSWQMFSLKPTCDEGVQKNSWAELGTLPQELGPIQYSHPS